MPYRKPEDERSQLFIQTIDILVFNILIHVY